MDIGARGHDDVGLAIAMTSWLVQIFELSDEFAQDIVAGLLVGLDGATVEAIVDPDRSRALVVVESTNWFQARSVFNLVASIDPESRLLHTSTGQRFHDAPADPDPASA